MKKLNLVQGSEQWKAVRNKFYRTASSASMMMSSHSNVTRDELLHMKATGTEQEFSDFVQKYVLDNGHAVEANARPFMEQKIADWFFDGDTDDAMLYQVTATDDDEYLLGSTDGLTDCGTVGWECKQWNESKAADVEAGILPECDKWQVIQSLVITRAKYWVYTVTDGTPEKEVSMVVSLTDADEKALMAGWKQFDEDLANYEVKEAKPVAIAETIPSLPALNIELFGEVKGSNLPSFATSAKQVIESIKTDLVTDQDFADSEAIVKFLKSGEQQLAEAKKTALSKTESIEALFRAVDDLSETMRQKRLTLEKLVKAEKENKRNAIFSAAKQELTDHIQKVNASFSIRVALPDITTDFTGAMKGKKLLSNMQSAVNDVLAKAKIEANQWAEKITANINAYAEAVKEEYRALLFPDLPTLILKDQDDFIAYVNNRIAMHEQQIREREELARKQAEESARLKAEADEATRLEAEARRIAQDAQDAQRMAEAEALAKNSAPALADIPLTTGAAMKAAAQSNDQVTLFDALTQFCHERGLNESTCNQLIALVGGYTSLDLAA